MSDAHYRVFGMSQDNSRYPCRLYAPAEYNDSPLSARRRICNGCGTASSWVIPDTLLFLPITPACDIHDWMYHFGQTIRDKEEADRVFLNNMVRIVESRRSFGFIRRARLTMAFFYYMAVVLFGGPSFWKGKNPEINMGERIGTEK